jgi:hypothetical protein
VKPLVDIAEAPRRAGAPIAEHPDYGEFGLASIGPSDKGMAAARFSLCGRRNNRVDYFDAEA